MIQARSELNVTTLSALTCTLIFLKVASYENFVSTIVPASIGYVRSFYCIGQPIDIFRNKSLWKKHIDLVARRYNAQRAFIVLNIVPIALK